jgi:uncharacterized protein (TIGR02246 family)
MGYLEDVEAIRQLVARYCHYIDQVRIDEWLDCFTEDGAFDFFGSRTEGRDALRELGSGMEATQASAPMRHVVTNVIVDVDGDTATSSSYLQILMAQRPPALMTSGRYEDRLRRIDGRWRFEERVLLPDEPPAAE